MCCTEVIISPALSSEIKGKQRKKGSLCVANNNVYHERVYANNVVSKFRFMRSCSFQQYPKVIANTTLKKVSQVRTKKCKGRFFYCQVNLNFLGPSRHFNCYTAFAVTVSFLNECVHGSNKIRNGKATNWVPDSKLLTTLKIFYQGTLTSPLKHFGTLMGRTFSKLQPSIDFPDSVAPAKIW